MTGGDDPVVLDVDASLVDIHTEDKEGTGPNYKGGFGFHPLFVFADATGECLAQMLRSGNANAGTVADHLRLLDEAIAQLPNEIAQGHREGDDVSLATREVVIRSDSAGCTVGFLLGCRARNVSFSVVPWRTAQVEASIFDADMRAHAHVEEHIGRPRDSGLLRFPFSNLEANRNWLFLDAYRRIALLA